MSSIHIALKMAQMFSLCHKIISQSRHCNGTQTDEEETDCVKSVVM